MLIIRSTLVLVAIFFLQSLDAQYTISRVTFPIDENQTADDLGAAGLDLTHGHGKQGSFFTTEVIDFELERLEDLGIRFTVDIHDLSAHRKASPTDPRNNLLECQNDPNDAIAPKNFELGSIGGFFSLPEILDHLDAMAYTYPDLISVRKPIGNFKTWDNNNIFWIRISDRPEVDENEPEILYTGLIHAREFISVSQMIFYMWYLLENYETNPMVKQIVDHTELYFIPVINPDGLNYNVSGYDKDDDEFNHFHRKNKRDNDGDGTFDPKNDGVDLNRNFAEHWAYDNIGSSSYEGATNYRGPSPFSEPETKAIQFFCNSHQFQFALNHHSYGNLLIYPWGFNNEHTVDSIAFINYAQLLTGLNRFVYGLGMETVGYATNGDSDDWMYGEHGTFAMTPEVGGSDDDFYPRRERIIPLCKSTLEMNLLAARLVNSLVSITDESPSFIEPGNNSLHLEFSRYGLLDGEVEVSFKAVTSNILEVPEPITFNLSKFETHERDLNFYVDDNIAYGSTARLEIICKQGEYTFRDTITKVRADISILVEDSGDLTHWNKIEGQNWGLTSTTFKSGPVSITDSPKGEYGENINEIIVLDEVIDLRNVTSAYAQFWARWDIEEEYDYVLFQASTNGEDWENLCGERSKLGGVFQVYEEPLYDGKQTQWVLETSDLTNYLGQQVQLRFFIGTDGYVFKDGFYFDDFKVITIREETVSTEDPETSIVTVYPNPVSNSFTFNIPDQEDVSVTIYNSLGREVYLHTSIEGSLHEVNTSRWPEGLYHYVIYAESLPVARGTICRQR